MVQYMHINDFIVLSCWSAVLIFLSFWKFRGEYMNKKFQMKNIEDDPTITPGSVTRSPLSLGIKDSELLSSISKTPTTNTVSDMTSHLTSLSLSSNTWSFNPGPGHHTNSPLSGYVNIVFVSTSRAWKVLSVLTDW